MTATMTATAPASVPRAYRVFQVGYALLALNFIVPAISYIVAPETTAHTADQVNRLLGGGPYPVTESGHLWHMLAVGNVMTLGFLCVLLLVDLRRFYPALPGLVFLKMFSALYSLGIGLAHHIPFFLGVFVLDLLTSIALYALATTAHKRMRSRYAPAP